jgi:uncharacterized membrane protein
MPGIQATLERVGPRAVKWLSLLAFVVLLLLLPLLFGQLMVESLEKLHVSPQAALVITIAIICGGLINIPVMRIERDDGVIADPLDVFGLGGLVPQIRRVRSETILAVNVGGAIIPASLAVYELLHLRADDSSVLLAAAFVMMANVVVCYFVARPISNIGIVMPGFVSPLVAAGLALLFAPDHAPSVAFVAGVLGPLIGADLLHVRDIKTTRTGIASIGGAGTFDGIVLSGIVAAYLA